MAENTVIIGVGNGGCKIVSKINLGMPKIFIDTDKKVIEKYSGLRIGENTCGNYSTNGDINLGELSVRESKTSILNATKNFDNILIIAPLSGGTSCGATKKLVELLLDNKKQVKVLTGTPFDFEGGIRLHKAVNALGYIKQLCETIKIENFDYKVAKENLSSNKIFEKQDEIYLSAIEKICV